MTGGSLWRQMVTRPRSTFLSFVVGAVALTVLVVYVVDQLSVDDDVGSFGTALSSDEAAQLTATISAVVTALDAANVTYWMNGGTLLGSYRHHGPIPWDDDVDLIVRVADKPVAYRALTALAPAFQLYVYRGDVRYPYAWRFYPSDGARIRFHTFWSGWRFPLVDLMFYAENETHVWSVTYDNECWPKSAVFPLRRRPFGALWVPAPCDVPAHLVVDYPNLDECQTTKIAHRTFRWKTAVRTVNCSELERKYPFVRRQKTTRDGYVVETLVSGGRNVHQILVADDCAAGDLPEGIKFSTDQSRMTASGGSAAV